MVCHQGILGIIVDDNIMNLEYLYYALQRLSGNLERYYLTGTQANLNLDVSKKLKIIHPKKIQEQKQIVSILSNVDTQIQKEKIHKSNLERLKKGLMQKLLTGQIRVKVR